MDSVAPPSTDANVDSVSLSGYLEQVRAALQQHGPSAAWVRAELSKVDRRGPHLYLDLVEHDANGQEVAKVRANAWGGSAAKLIEKFQEAGARLEAGIKVLLRCRASFHVQYGISLQITDIDPRYTIGDMAAKVQQIRQWLVAKGIYERNRRLPVPSDYCRVAVISPDGAAGLGDFRREADLLARFGLCEFQYFGATFQGVSAPATIFEAILAAHQAHEASPLDALVIIRGGGAASDLAWLNDAKLALAVARFPVPVITGIGHERDNTILDELGIRCDTPSKVIGHIANTIIGAARSAEDSMRTVRENAERLATLGEQRVDRAFAAVMDGRWRWLQRAGDLLARGERAIRERAQTTVERAQELLAGEHQQIGRRAVDCIHTAAQSLAGLRHSVHERAGSSLHQAESDSAVQIRIVRDQAMHHVAFAANRIEQLRSTVLDSGRRTATGSEQQLEAAAEQVRLLAQRSLAEQSRSIEQARHEVIASAKRELAQAERDTKALIGEILGLGPQATLRRGFALVRAGAVPVISRAHAEQHHDLEIEFHDGKVPVQRIEE